MHVNGAIQERFPDGWEEAYGIDEEEAFEEFCDTWDRVLFDPNTTPLE